MSLLAIYPDNNPLQGERYSGYDAICQQLAAIGVQFERWATVDGLAADAGPTTVLAAYAEPVTLLSGQYGFQSVDVISLNPAHPNKVELRQKFLAEHTHDDFEVRFFVAGSALFYLHVGAKVYTVLCEQGDLISVPAHTPHWFDMGENPYFVAIRLFTTAEGWVAQMTGSTIAHSFPSYDETVASL